MNLKRMDSFEELNPRTAPAPKSFSAVPVSSTVPEISLVFGPSPGTLRQPVKQTVLGNLEYHVQNPLSCDGIVNVTKIQDNSFKNLHKGRLGEVDRLNNMQSASQVNHLLSSQLQRGIKSQNDQLSRMCDSQFRKTPSNPLANLNMENYNGMTCSYEAYRSSPPENQKKFASQDVSQESIQETGNYAVGTKGILAKNRVHSCNGVKLDHQIDAHCCTENRMHGNPLSERTRGCTQNRTIPSNDLYASNKIQCCLNHNNCVLAQDVAIDNKTSSSTCVPPDDIDVPYRISHLSVGASRPYCTSRVSCETLRDIDVCDVLHNQSGEYVTVQTDVNNKYSDSNEHFPQNNQAIYRRKNVHDDLISTKSLPRLNDYTAHRYKEHSKIHTKHSKTVQSYESDLHIACSSAKVGRQDSKSKMSPVKAAESKERKSERKSSDTSILQEIALMNSKQCSILQGLLQQVVSMQADQMKILSEINEKLSNAQISENAVHKTVKENDIVPKVVPKLANVTTQTNTSDSLDICCQKCEMKNENVVSPNPKCSLKNNTSNPECRMNEPKDNILNHPEQGKEQSEGKKLLDRGVSWSAVHEIETVEESFTLHGVCVPTVVDQLPSSMHTMHLHLQDYHSSASFDSIAENRHNLMNKNSHENGQDNHKGSWTLYDNIVDHVKKFLQTVPCEKNGSTTQKTSQVEAIRFATIEKIRQLGVSVYENSAEIKETNATGRIHFESKSQSPHCDFLPPVEKGNDDNSMELHALALKYLQGDDLCDLVKWNQNSKTPSILKTSQKSANISLATQHYLEKYHLLPPGTDNMDRRPINPHCGQFCVEDNILDITTLKRQPKLL